MFVKIATDSDSISAKKRPLYYAFVDVEKAYDRIPRKVVRWALRDAGVDEYSYVGGYSYENLQGCAPKIFP